MNDKERYEGKPFLRLLEFYVMRAIGALTSEQEQLLSAMTPKLQETYKHSGRWYEIIADQMEFPATFPQTICDVWEKVRISSSEAGKELTATEFTMNFVDVNFPS